MNYKIAIFALIALALSDITVSQPAGKYCGDVLGNPLTMNINTTDKIVNIAAHIFGSKLSCPKETYNYNKTNYQLNLPSNQNDCLNKVLTEYGACPCPPDVFYDPKTNELNIEHSLAGTITLKSC